MNKIILLLLLTLSLSAKSSYELKIYESMLTQLFGKKIIYVFADKKMEDILKDSNYIELTDNCDDAMIIITSDCDLLDQDCYKKPFLSTSYKTYKKNKNSIGAFYWRKGRPQIRVSSINMEKFAMHLPSSLEKYNR